MTTARYLCFSFATKLYTRRHIESFCPDCLVHVSAFCRQSPFVHPLDWLCTSHRVGDHTSVGHYLNQMGQGWGPRLEKQPCRNHAITPRKHAPSNRTWMAPQPVLNFASVRLPLNLIQCGILNHTRGEMSIRVALPTTATIVTIKQNTPINCFIGNSAFQTRP